LSEVYSDMTQAPQVERYRIPEDMVRHLDSRVSVTIDIAQEDILKARFDRVMDMIRSAREHKAKADANQYTGVSQDNVPHLQMARSSV
jgi:hypothetical protein